MFCTKCGNDIPEGYQFCNNCGAPVSQSSPAMMPQPQPVGQQAVAPVAPKKSKAPAIVIIVIVVLLLVLGSLLAYHFLSQSQADSGYEGPTQSTQTDTGGDADGKSSGTTAMPTYAAPNFTTVTVSSQLPADENSSDYGPATLSDGDYNTAWNENSSSDGTGEWVNFEASASQHVTGLSVVNGFPKYMASGADVYYQNNRVQGVQVTFSDGTYEDFTLADTRGTEQTINFSTAHDVTWMKVTITSVYKGDLYNDCCLAELTVF